VHKNTFVTNLCSQQKKKERKKENVRRTSRRVPNAATEQRNVPLSWLSLDVNLW